jgi:hypothetical protein
MLQQVHSSDVSGCRRKNEHCCGAGSITLPALFSSPVLSPRRSPGSVVIGRSALRNCVLNAVSQVFRDAMAFSGFPAAFGNFLPWRIISLRAFPAIPIRSGAAKDIKPLQHLHRHALAPSDDGTNFLKTPFNIPCGQGIAPACIGWDQDMFAGPQGSKGPGLCVKRNPALQSQGGQR